MKVLKFGGTSLGSVENIYKIKDILEQDKNEKIVVCSAVSGITNQLIELAEEIKNNNRNLISKYLREIQNSHNDIIENLIDDQEVVYNIKQEISFLIIDLFEICEGTFSEEMYSRIITYGELLSTQMVSRFLNYYEVANVLLDAKSFMYVDAVESPNIKKIRNKLRQVIHNNTPSNIYITQGYVCKDKNNQVNHLERGGSDYTATIIGAALQVKEIQIWTDIDGIHNNDPRYVSDTYPISHITYNEASSLAFFGAKILHPHTVAPVIDQNIPILLKNTFSPNAIGTRISNQVSHKGLKAISAKDNITVLKLKSNKTLTNCEYFKKTFEIFCDYKISVDMITTSETSMSFAIETLYNLNDAILDLKEYATIDTYYNYSIICVVGNSIIDDENTSKIFEILRHTNLRMISYGNNEDHISILVNSKEKIPALNFLNQKLFQTQYQMV